MLKNFPKPNTNNNNNIMIVTNQSLSRTTNLMIPSIPENSTETLTSTNSLKRKQSHLEFDIPDLREVKHLKHFLTEKIPKTKKKILLFIIKGSEADLDFLSAKTKRFFKENPLNEIEFLYHFVTKSSSRTLKRCYIMYPLPVFLVFEGGKKLSEIGMKRHNGETLASVLSRIKSICITILAEGFRKGINDVLQAQNQARSFTKKNSLDQDLGYNFGVGEEAENAERRLKHNKDYEGSRKGLTSIGSGQIPGFGGHPNRQIFGKVNLTSFDNSVASGSEIGTSGNGVLKKATLSSIGMKNNRNSYENIKNPPKEPKKKKKRKKPKFQTFPKHFNKDAVFSFKIPINQQAFTASFGMRSRQGSRISQNSKKSSDRFDYDHKKNRKKLSKCGSLGLGSDKFIHHRNATHPPIPPVHGGSSKMVRVSKAKYNSSNDSMGIPGGSSHSRKRPQRAKKAKKVYSRARELSDHFLRLFTRQFLKNALSEHEYLVFSLFLLIRSVRSTKKLKKISKNSSLKKVVSYLRKIGRTDVFEDFLVENAHHADPELLFTIIFQIFEMSKKSKTEAVFNYFEKSKDLNSYQIRYREMIKRSFDQNYPQILKILKGVVEGGSGLQIIFKILQAPQITISNAEIDIQDPSELPMTRPTQERPMTAAPPLKALKVFAASNQAVDLFGGNQQLYQRFREMVDHQEERIVSAFEIYLGDKDQYELFDTILRVVNQSVKGSRSSPLEQDLEQDANEGHERHADGLDIEVSSRSSDTNSDEDSDLNSQEAPRKGHNEERSHGKKAISDFLKKNESKQSFYARASYKFGGTFSPDASPKSDEKARHRHSNQQIPQLDIINSLQKTGPVNKYYEKGRITEDEGEDEMDTEQATDTKKGSPDEIVNHHPRPVPQRVKHLIEQKNLGYRGSGNLGPPGVHSSSEKKTAKPRWKPAVLSKLGSSNQLDKKSSELSDEFNLRLAEKPIPQSAGMQATPRNQSAGIGFFSKLDDSKIIDVDSKQKDHQQYDGSLEEPMTFFKERNQSSISKSHQSESSKIKSSNTKNSTGRNFESESKQRRLNRKMSKDDLDLMMMSTHHEAQSKKIRKVSEDTKKVTSGDEFCWEVIEEGTKKGSGSSPRADTRQSQQIKEASSNKEEDDFDIIQPNMEFKEAAESESNVIVRKESSSKFQSVKEASQGRYSKRSSMNRSNSSAVVVNQKNPFPKLPSIFNNNCDSVERVLSPPYTSSMSLVKEPQHISALENLEDYGSLTDKDLVAFETNLVRFTLDQITMHEKFSLLLLELVKGDMDPYYLRDHIVDLTKSEMIQLFSKDFKMQEIQMILNRKADFKDIFDTKLTGKPSYDKAKGMIKELVEKLDNEEVSEALSKSRNDSPQLSRVAKSTFGNMAESSLMRRRQNSFNKSKTSISPRNRSRTSLTKANLKYKKGQKYRKLKIDLPTKNIRNKKKKQKDTRVIKIIPMAQAHTHSNLNVIEPAPGSDKAVSVISRYSRVSRIPSEVERKKKEEFFDILYREELSGKNGLLALLNEMIEEAVQNGIIINEHHMHNLHDQMTHSHPQLLNLLHMFRHPTPESSQKKDHRLTEEIMEQLESLKKLSPDALTTMTQNVESRRDHFIVFSSLLTYLKNNVFLINESHYDMFMHLLITENILLLSAYEVYLNRLELDDFVDTLFLIYRTYYKENDVNLSAGNDNIKEKQNNILFQYKKFLNRREYDKLVDLVKFGDNQCFRLYQKFFKAMEGDIGVGIGKSVDGRQKFVKELKKYAQNKMKREKELKRKRALNKNNSKQDEWKLDFEILAQKKIKKMKIKDKTLVQTLIADNHDLAQAMIEVFNKTHDMGDLNENIKILVQASYKKKLMVGGEVPKLQQVLLNNGYDAVTVQKITQILEDSNHPLHTKLLDVKELYDVLEDDEELIENIKLFTNEI